MYPPGIFVRDRLHFTEGAGDRLQPVRSSGPPDLTAELGKRRVSKGDGHRQVNVEQFVDSAMTLRRAQGVAADRKKVIEHPHGPHSDHLPPDVRQQGVDRILRCDVGGGQLLSQFLRQTDALDLAGGTFGYGSGR